MLPLVERKDPEMTATLQRRNQSSSTDALGGVDLLNRPLLNKGTAFSEEERGELGFKWPAPTAL